MKPIKPFEPVEKNQVPTGSAWLSQVKWDGVRILAYFDGKTVRLFNRKQNERTMNYPELTDILSYCRAQSAILDGEVVALGEGGTPDFHEVMRRDGVRSDAKVRHVWGQVPVFYMIFDIIYYNGEWIQQYHTEQRQAILADVIVPNEHVQLVRSETDGTALFEAIKQKGMEGIVAKRKDAPYLIGDKKDAWVKVKNKLDMVAVVGGFTLNNGAANALLLGLYDTTGRLFYIGHCGSGKLNDEHWRLLVDKLDVLKMKKKPFENRPEREKEAHWVEPKVTVKVKFSEWTKDQTLRQPVLEEVVQEDPERCIFE